MKREVENFLVGRRIKEKVMRCGYEHRARHLCRLTCWYVVGRDSIIVIEARSKDFPSLKVGKDCYRICI